VAEIAAEAKTPENPSEVKVDVNTEAANQNNALSQPPEGRRFCRAPIFSCTILLPKPTGDRHQQPHSGQLINTTEARPPAPLHQRQQGWQTAKLAAAARG